MFKYVKFTKVETANTVLEFRGGDEVTKVNHFDLDVVSISADNEADIDALIAAQVTEINCIEITQAEFKTLVTNSAQLNRIRAIVAENVAKRYTISDEMAINKRAIDDVKRITYDAYVQECIAIGHGMKDEIGY